MGILLNCVRGTAMDDELVTIATFSLVQEALFAKGLLESNDIEVFLADEVMTRVYFPAVLGGVRLQVRREDAEKASALLAEGLADQQDE